MIDPVVYHPELFHRGLREFRVWPYRDEDMVQATDTPDMEKPRKARRVRRRSGRWSGSA